MKIQNVGHTIIEIFLAVGLLEYLKSQSFVTDFYNFVQTQPTSVWSTKKTDFCRFGIVVSLVAIQFLVHSTVQIS